MKRTQVCFVLLALLSSAPAFAWPSLPDIRTTICRMACVLYYGDCLIRDPRDPDVIPLKDPYCEERRAACLNSCGNGSIAAAPALRLPTTSSGPALVCSVP